MGIKAIFEDELRKRQQSAARNAIESAFRGGIAGKTTLGELTDELQGDEHLWEAFRQLRMADLRDLLVGGKGAGAPPGPSRKRGLTSRRIVDFVQSNPGARRSDIMAALGLKGGTVSSQLRNLRTSGRLRGEGEERNLRYFVAD